MLEELTKLKRQQTARLVLLFIIIAILGAGCIWVSGHQLSGKPDWIIGLVDVGIIAILGLMSIPMILTLLTTPTSVLANAILYIESDHSSVAAPDLKKIGIGQKALTELVSRIYDLASSTGRTTNSSGNVSTLQDLSDKIPLPIVSLSPDSKIVFVNQAAEDYVGLHASQMIGQAFYDVFKLAFTSTNTFEAWLKDCQSSKAVDRIVWERVRLLNESRPDLMKQLDVAAYYNQNNPYGNEVIVAFFDRSSVYEQDDKDLSFVALAVHELRTPITIMRGYLEVLEEDVASDLDGEHKRFMNNLKVSAETLGGYINNILNVARVENNQLELHLNETAWPEVVNQAVSAMQLKAASTNVKIVADIALDLPHVGVDRISIYEVLTNLLDNAIKYSPNGSTVKVASYMKDGFVETTISDTGIGIPAALLPHLFDKFYRSHRSRAQIGGTGLGLYLCKKIVEAHDGEIWVNTKEKEGSTFGFKVHPWDQLASERKSSDNAGITRGAHGWIKNHTLYRG